MFAVAHCSFTTQLVLHHLLKLGKFNCQEVQDKFNVVI